MSAIKRSFMALNSPSVTNSMLSASKKHRPNKQDNHTSNTIQVFARFRANPLGDTLNETYVIDAEESSVTFNKSTEAIVKNGGKTKFMFNEVFDDEVSQLDVMKSTCVPLISDLLLKKKSSLLFSYGVTNAGKTYTIVGTREDPGILPRAVSILNEVKDFININYTNPNAIYELPELDFAMSSVYWLSSETNLTIKGASLKFESFEIYNEEIYDLVTNPKERKLTGTGRPKLQMKEKDNKKIFIKDLTTTEIQSHATWYELLNRCHNNRTTSDNNINSKSSRSHTISRIIFQFHYGNGKDSYTQEATLCIVDLAGAERAKKTANSGAELAEAGKINQSLLILARCIKALTNNVPSVVPYRDCKLTRILYEYINEDCNLRMIANINPAISDFEESLRVLDYASQSKEIQPIKSRIDSTRKNIMNFPISAYNRSRSGEDSYQDTISLLSHDDISFRNFLEDKESTNNTSLVYPTLQQDKKPELLDVLQNKLITSAQEIAEKNSKIQILEDMVAKLQNDRSNEEMTTNLHKVNEEAKHDAFNYFAKNPIQEAERNAEKAEVDDSKRALDMSLKNRALVNFFVFNSLSPNILSNISSIINETPAHASVVLSNKEVSIRSDSFLIQNQVTNPVCTEGFQEYGENLHNSKDTKATKGKKKKVQRKNSSKNAKNNTEETQLNAERQENYDSDKENTQFIDDYTENQKKKARNKRKDDLKTGLEIEQSVEKLSTPIARRLRERPKRC